MDIYYLVIITSLFIILNTILFIQRKTAFTSSDNPSHVGLINAIRRNKYRFITKYPNHICENHFAYPQFFHWILSFIPEKKLNKCIPPISYIINNLSLLLFIIFCFTIFSKDLTGLTTYKYIFICGLIYIFTPFSYIGWNAKNTGFGVRGFGLLLAHVYTYLLFLYSISGNNTYIFCAFFFGYLIIISSQFAFQYLIFSAPAFALFFDTPIILLIPVFSLCFFYITFPKVARNFIIGQYWHKRIYLKYLADIFILNKRYSIWRDFIWDFWIKMKADFKDSIIYILRNPLISIIYGFPFLIAILILLSFNYDFRKEIFSDNITTSLMLFILIPCLVFLLTSFRKTRFLGEPERYMEFSIPFISIMTVILFEKYLFLSIVLIVFSVFIVVGQFIALYYIKKTDNNTHLFDTTNASLINNIKRCIETNYNMPIRLFSNNIEVLKYFLDNPNYFILKPNITSINTGQFNFTQIFPVEYPNVSQNVILPLIKEFDIDWFILDQKINPELNEYEKEGICLKEEKVIDNVILYRVYKT